MPKWIIPLMLVLCLTGILSGCEGEEINKDVLGTYAGKIEDSKDQLVEGLESLQGIADEALKNYQEKSGGG